MCAVLRSCRAPARPFQKRRAAAVAELAICLPLITLIVFGSIEACNVVFLKQALVEAAYGGALVGSQPGMAESDIVQHVNTILAARNLSGTTVTVDANGASYDSSTAGDRFTVGVEADVAGNIVGPLWFTTIPRVDADVVGRKQ